MIPQPVHWSNLRWMRQSPAHYRYYMEHVIDETPPMRMGSIVHGIVFGVQHAFVIYEEARRGNAWKEFKEQHHGMRIITRDEYDNGYQVAQAVLANKDVKQIIRGAKEQSIAWQMDGRACAGTPDVTNHVLVDLKVTADARPEKFRWQAQRMGWFAQLDWYRNGLELAGRTKPAACYIIAAEPKPPYPVVVYELTAQALDIGRRTWRLLWERLRACEESDAWPGYVESIQPLDCPEDELSLVIEGEEVVL